MKKSIKGFSKDFLDKVTTEEVCTECLHTLQLLVDGEASQEQENYLRAHIDVCMPCYNFYNVEKSVKEFIQKKIERKPVPDALIQQIKNKISQTI